MSNYSAPWLVELFHRVPRISITGTKVTNVFDIADNEYLKAVAIQAGGIWAFAGIVLVAFSIAFVGACCCRHKAAPSKVVCCRLNCAAICYAIASGLLTVGAITAIVYVSKFDKGAFELINAVNGFTGVLDSSTTALIPLVDATASAAVSADALYGLAISAGATQPTLDIILALQYTAGNVSTTADALYVDLNRTVSGFEDDFRTTDSGQNLPAQAFSPSSDYVDVTGTRRGVTITAMGFMGTALAWILFTMCILAPSRLSSCLFKSTSFITILAGTLILVLTGGLYGVALLGSDICIDPNSALLRTLNRTSGGDASIAADSVYYYSQCGANSSITPTGVYAQSQLLGVALRDVQRELDLVNATVYADPTLDPLKPVLSDLAGSIGLAASSSLGLESSLSCGPASVVWGNLVSGLCTGAILAVDESVFAFAAASLMLLVLLCTGVSLQCNHPGDGPGKSRRDEYEDAMEDLRGAQGGASRAQRVSAMTLGEYEAGKPVRGYAPALTGSYQGGDAPAVSETRRKNR